MATIFSSENVTMTRIAWVTGASGGIGKAVTQYLAHAGYRVFASARRAEKLEELRSAAVMPLALDVTEPQAVTKAAERIAEVAGRLDVLVNNAGFGLYGTIEGASDEDVRRQFEVNVFGLGCVTRAALPLLRHGESPTIVNISSVVGKLALPFAGWYSATKHAVEALSDALRLETAPLGIRVVVVEPGAIKTDFDAVALDLPEDATAGRVLAALSDPARGALADVARRSRLAVNQSFARDDAPVRPGDEVALIPPVGGG